MSEAGGVGTLLRIERWGWLIAAILFAVPLACLDVIPLTDLGGHLGRFTVQLDQGRTLHLAKWYSFDWHLVPNLGVDLMVAVIGPALGVESAVKAAVLFTNAISAAGIILVSRAVHGRVTPGAILALPFIYGFTFHFGFLNFNLSLGMALCLVVLWIKCEEWSLSKRWGLLAAACTVLWICHLVGWAIFSIIVGSRELMRQLERGRAVKALLTTGALLSASLFPIVLGPMFGPDVEGKGTTDFFGAWLLKLMGLLFSLRDRWLAFDLFSISFVVVSLGWMWASKTMRLDKGLALAASILALSVVVLPHQLLGSEFADVRLIGPLLIVALLATRPGPKLPNEALPALLIAAVCFTGSRLVYNSWSIWERGKQLDAELQVIEFLPYGAELLTLRARACDQAKDWELDWRTHLAGYALARRHAFANDQWQIPGAQLLTITNPNAGQYMAEPSPKIWTGDCSHPQQRLHHINSVAQHVSASMTHLWVIWPSKPDDLDGWKTMHRSGHSVLYTRDTTVIE